MKKQFYNKRLNWYDFVFVHWIWTALEIFKQFWGCHRFSLVFVMSIDVEIVLQYGLGAMYDLWGCQQYFVRYKWRFRNELSDFASTTPPQSGPGSPSRASEIDFMMLKRKERNNTNRSWRGTWCPITQVQTDHYRHARQVLWGLLQHLLHLKPTKVGAFGRHLFCGFLCNGFEYGKYRSSHHNTVMFGLSICDWTSCSSPLGFHVPSPFWQCACAQGGSGGPSSQVGGRSGGPFGLPEKQGSLKGRRPPNSIPRQSPNLCSAKVNFVAGCSTYLKGPLVLLWS